MNQFPLREAIARQLLLTILRCAAAPRATSLYVTNTADVMHHARTVGTVGVAGSK